MCVECLHPALLACFVHPSVCPLPSPSTFSNPPHTLEGGRAGGCERGVCAALSAGGGGGGRAVTRGAAAAAQPADHHSLAGMDAGRAGPGARGQESGPPGC